MQLTRQVKDVQDQARRMVHKTQRRNIEMQKTNVNGKDGVGRKGGRTMQPAQLKLVQRRLERDTQVENTLRYEVY